MKGDKITDKQEKFVQGLLKGLSQRQAYKAAYNTFKMKDKTIDEKACKLLTDSKVKTRYEELNSKLLKNAEKKAIATAEDVLRYLTKVMYGEETEEIIAGLNNDGDANRILKKVAPKDRIKAAELLGKRYALFNENLNINGNINAKVTLTSEERENRIKELKEKLGEE